MEWHVTTIGLINTDRSSEMNRRLVALAVFSFFFLGLYGQELKIPMSAPRINYFQCFCFGPKLGVNMPRLYYTNPYLQDLPHDFLVKQSLGLFMEFPISKKLGLEIDVNHQVRGGETSYFYEGLYDVKYSLSADYVSLRVPLCYYFCVSDSFRPYLLLGPDIGGVVKGKISLSQIGPENTENSLEVDQSNMNLYYIGILGGAGVRTILSISDLTLVIKADAAVNFGFSDTFSEMEQVEAVASSNVHAYNLNGKRFSRGLEVHVCIGYVPNRKDDVCDRFTNYPSKKIKLTW